MKQIKLMGIRIDNVTMDETVIKIENLIKLKNNAYVLTPNVDHIVKVQHDPEFRTIYEEADLVIPDGVGVILASRILKKPLKEKVSGSDLFPVLCKFCELNGYSIFLLGGTTEKIINETVEKLGRDFPELKIAGYESPVFGFEKDESESNRLALKIKNATPDILFVGVGAPKQEKWIFKHKVHYHTPVSIGVGATFNFYSGNIKRAPKWMQKYGLEWFYRVLQEPRLFKRYFIDDLEFFNLLFKELKSPSK